MNIPILKFFPLSFVSLHKISSKMSIDVTFKILSIELNDGELKVDKNKLSVDVEFAGKNFVIQPNKDGIKKKPRGLIQPAGLAEKKSSERVRESNSKAKKVKTDLRSSSTSKSIPNQRSSTEPPPKKPSSTTVLPKTPSATKTPPKKPSSAEPPSRDSAQPVASHTTLLTSEDPAQDFLYLSAPLPKEFFGLITERFIVNPNCICHKKPKNNVEYKIMENRQLIGEPRNLRKLENI